MYKAVIGLEVHIELSTKSKMFCGCPAEHFLAEANTQVCPICLGLPGALPYANREAIDSTIMFGLALGCRISNFSKFDRKHYFYPDLPKGYQISQYDTPLCMGGKFEIKTAKSETKVIKIRRVHLEEDTGKLVHTTVGGKRVSLVDFNRSGVALMEMVTDPDFETPNEVDQFLREMQLIVRYLGISSADMEKGSMRLEANISMREENSELADYKVELKNINSFKFLRKALEAEIERQREILTSGGKVTQETRGYDESANTTFSQRIKEEAQDYRYFPEPDIPPVELSDSEISALGEKLPEMPKRRKLRFEKEYGISQEYAQILTLSRERADYYEESAQLCKTVPELDAKTVARVMVNQNLDKDCPEPAGLIKHLIGVVLQEFASTDEVWKAVEGVIEGQEKAMEDYQKGNSKVIGFLIGQVQKALKGKGEPKMVNELILKKLRNGS
jgi:aspartyl-tRNA(Asn)/glutamyl-tRNA(Gln) amidotransferase subunit B